MDRSTYPSSSSSSSSSSSLSCPIMRGGGGGEIRREGLESNRLSLSTQRSTHHIRIHHQKAPRRRGGAAASSAPRAPERFGDGAAGPGRAEVGQPAAGKAKGKKKPRSATLDNISIGFVAFFYRRRRRPAARPRCYPHRTPAVNRAQTLIACEEHTNASAYQLANWQVNRITCDPVPAQPAGHASPSRRDPALALDAVSLPPRAARRAAACDPPRRPQEEARQRVRSLCPLSI